ncbi:hypothetical protein RYX36_001196 [Vicia faba]
MYASILGPKLDKLPNQDDAILLFQLWKKEHGRVYGNQQEMAKKFDVFVSNVKYIVETNAKRDSPHSSLLGLTNFADLSFTEFKDTYMTMNTDTIDIVNDDVDELTSFAIKTGKLLSLSNQEVLDCEPYGNCSRGSVAKALDWVIGNKGIALQEDYPYFEEKSVCTSGQIQNSPTSRIKSYKLVKRSEKELQCAVAKQPLHVGFYGRTKEFQHYKGGVYRGQECPLDLLNVTHGLVIVGYDSVDSDEYWIVKNSWGTIWGKDGYMFVKRVYRGQECPLDLLNVTHSMVIVGYDSIDNDEYWIVKNSWSTIWEKDGYMLVKKAHW